MLYEEDDHLRFTPLCIRAIGTNDPWTEAYDYGIRYFHLYEYVYLDLGDWDFLV